MESLLLGALLLLSSGVLPTNSFGISRTSNNDIIAKGKLCSHPTMLKKSFILSVRRSSRAVEEEEEEDEDEEFWDDVVDSRRPQWESCGDLANAKVLLPSTTSSSQLPTAILHFIGGTGFGTFPQFTYGTFLEELSENGSYIVVSTPPEMMISSNPLNHQRIAYECARSFRIAYRTIIEEEYGVYEAQSIPIVGLGHSMGSRIHVILNTQRKLRRIGFPREANVLLSFNNYDATRSIPFLYEVGMISQKAFQSLLSTTSSTWDAIKNNEWLTTLLSEPTTKARKQKNIPNTGRRKDYYQYDDDDDYDDEIWDDDEDGYYSTSTRQRKRQQQIQQQSIRDQTRNGMEWISTQLKEQLSKTNHNSYGNHALEFQPSPSELLQLVHNGKYGVPKTLLIQFDQDDLDQSSVLARALLKQQEQQQSEEAHTYNNTNFSNGQDVAATDNSDLLMGVKMDVKFAYLKGTHLTPIIRDPTSFVAARRSNKREFRNQQQEQSYTPPLEEGEVDVEIQNINQELRDLVSTITTYIDHILIAPSYSI
jgi:hypothetical protein